MLALANIKLADVRKEVTVARNTNISLSLWVEGSAFQVFWVEQADYCMISLIYNKSCSSASTGQRLRMCLVKILLLVG